MKKQSKDKSKSRVVEERRQGLGQQKRPGETPPNTKYQPKTGSSKKPGMNPPDEYSIDE